MKSNQITAVREKLSHAKGIAWDTCHKIYVLMDDEQMKLMAEYGYDPLIKAEESDLEELFVRIDDWWENSCALRFIEAVSTNEEDPNAGFETIISQFEKE